MDFQSTNNLASGTSSQKTPEDIFVFEILDILVFKTPCADFRLIPI